MNAGFFNQSCRRINDEGQSIITGKNLLTTGNHCSHYRVYVFITGDFPVKPCTSLLGIAVQHYHLNFRYQQLKKIWKCEGSFVMSIFKKFGFHKVTRFNALEARREGWTDARSAVGFCLGSGLFGSYNSD